jgi:[ribosomal protein S18]-alanine N-acetyltransferase
MGDLGGCSERYLDLQTHFMKVLQLKALQPNQLEAVVELDRRCLGGMWTIDGYRRELDSPNSDLLILQSESSQILGVGCVWAILEEAHITMLAIDPQFQRQGLGLALLHSLLGSARQRGLEWATLEVRVSNTGAIALYERFGFESVGERKRYYQNPEENALILWRKGLQRDEFEQQWLEWQQEISDRLRESGWQFQRM